MFKVGMIGLLISLAPGLTWAGVEFTCFPADAISAGQIEVLLASYDADQATLTMIASDNNGTEKKEVVLNAERSTEENAVFYASDIGVLIVDLEEESSHPTAMLMMMPEMTQVPFTCETQKN